MLDAASGAALKTCAVRLGSLADTGTLQHAEAVDRPFFGGTKSRAGAFSAAMPKAPRHHKAERSFQASIAEAERLARAQKNARLKNLRTHASWLVLDRQARFQEEIDCSVLLGDLSIRKVARDG